MCVAVTKQRDTEMGQQSLLFQVSKGLVGREGPLRGGATTGCVPTDRLP